MVNRGLIQFRNVKRILRADASELTSSLADRTLGHSLKAQAAE
jgi:hypothetical protein